MPGDTGKISDGYHTFDELYEHRCRLFLTLCKIYSEYLDGLAYFTRADKVWRSKLHSDGTAYGGWFLLGINSKQGEQITYHLPERFWEEASFAATLDRAPQFDGHTSADVLERLKLFAAGKI